ncbi:hypothetical protein FMEXI_8400 [Fusarium mexicanum]|uniref:Uncharacterized protein n=1 Tax=Fusarium mexicanum TaxID=751941 RepID=A0A8H5MS72_9HYPO|nr:hypothetical protein FMEXI_8400 [Fusarium mexicanum]
MSLIQTVRLRNVKRLFAVLNEDRSDWEVILIRALNELVAHGCQGLEWLVLDHKHALREASAPDESLMLHPISLTDPDIDADLEAMAVMLDKDFENLTHLAITLHQGALVDGIKFQGHSCSGADMQIHEWYIRNVQSTPGYCPQPTGWGYATGQNGRVRRSLIRYTKSSLPQGEDFQAEVASVQEPPALDLTDAEKETNGLGVVVGLLLPLHCETPVGINLVRAFNAETGHVIPHQAGCLLVIRPLWRNNGEFHVLYKYDEHRPLRLSMKLPRTLADSHLVYYDEWATSLKGPMKLDSVTKGWRRNITSF